MGTNGHTRDEHWQSQADHLDTVALESGIDPDATVIDGGTSPWDEDDDDGGETIDAMATVQRDPELAEGSSGGGPRAGASGGPAGGGWGEPVGHNTEIDPEGTLLGYAAEVQQPAPPPQPARAPQAAAASQPIAPLAGPRYPEIETPYPGESPDVGLTTIDSRWTGTSMPAVPSAPPRRSWFGRLLDWFRGRPAAPEEEVFDEDYGPTHTVVERMVKQRRPRS